MNKLAIAVYWGLPMRAAPKGHPTHCTRRRAGATLELGDAPSTVKLVSSPLSMGFMNIQSAEAMALTDNTWDAQTGLPDDKLPELPPDGEGQLACCAWRAAVA